MELNRKNISTKRLHVLFRTSILFCSIILLNSCLISYKFNGASIDYTKTKSISIGNFPNIAPLVYAPLSQEFAETLKDTYTKQTRLKVLNKGGDLHLEGEITGYQLTPMSIGTDAYASETKLTITINIRFTNNVNPNDDFEKNYIAYQTFDSNLMLNDVQDQLLQTMTEEIADKIYNDTVAKW